MRIAEARPGTPVNCRLYCEVEKLTDKVGKLLDLLPGDTGK